MTIHESLFRQEVISNNTSQLMGSIRLNQAASSWIVVIIASIISFSLIIFVSFGTITKKNRIGGIVVPNRGTVSIVSPTSGIIVRNDVREGQKVLAGQTVFELSTERQSSNGEISELVEQQLKIRLDALKRERSAKIQQFEDKRHAIAVKRNNIEEQIGEIKNEINLLRQRKEMGEKSLAKLETLQTSGYVSESQTQQKREDLVDLAARSSELSRSHAQLEASLLASSADYEDIVNNFKVDLAQLDRETAAINQEITENRNRKGSLIVTAEPGTITTITYQPGQSVHAGETLATLVPTSTQKKNYDESLEVNLYAPSRTAGFVAPGQKVLIRYHAFPYQKFGLQEGTVTDVSQTPFAPSELPSNIASTILSNGAQSPSTSALNEGLFRIKVKLTTQSILVYGKNIPIKPGMTLDADIVQDKRKIWEWVFEPILAVAQR